MTYTMFDQVFWRAISGQVNRWRKKTIGIGSTSLDRMEQHKVPFIYNFSPTVVPPPLDWYEWIRVSGYWFLDGADDSDSKKWEPPEGMLDFIERAHADGKKVVYIGFGSIVVSDPDAMTECVVQSVLDSDVRAILSKGWSDRLSVKKGDDDEAEKDDRTEEEKQAAEEEKKAKEEAKKAKEAKQFPPEIFSVSSVPHDWLFSRIDAACHHGGGASSLSLLWTSLHGVVQMG
jgi:sterol 3beta-glucosyltransferase